MQTRFPSFAALLLLVAGCSGGYADDPHRTNSGDDDDDEDFRRAFTEADLSCPPDPDACISEGAPCPRIECPTVWNCRDLEELEEAKQCVQPGYAQPDGTGTWTCTETESGTVVCRGTALPDGGGGTKWACEEKAEYVECIDANPGVPDEGTGLVWDCEIKDEFRLCTGAPDDSVNWRCYTGEGGATTCRRTDIDYPDDRDWMCVDRDGTTRCRAPGGLPDGGGGTPYDCAIEAEFVVCEADTPQPPPPGVPVLPGDDDDDLGDGGGGTPWQCTYEDEFLECTTGEIVPPPTGDGGSAVPGSACPTDGLIRRCDSARYCGWGRQICTDDGWSECIEGTAAELADDRPGTELACYYFYFNPDVCEDQEDRDDDGFADCLFIEDESDRAGLPAEYQDVPLSTGSPDCDYTSTYCSACDPYNVPDSSRGVCLIHAVGHNDLETYFSTTCTRQSDCPSDATCKNMITASGSYNLCIPNDGSCIGD